MVGLRRSFWPMMGGNGRGSRPRVIQGWIPGHLTNYPANSSKETLRSMTSTVPPRDWTEIHWPDIASSRRRALDRGAAAGGDRTARPASAAGNRRPDRRGLSGAGARAVACRTSRHLSAAAAGRHFHRAYRLSGHADAADRGRAEGMDGDRRKRRASRHPEAGDGDQPWRQQRGDVAGGAGSARASSDCSWSPRAGRASARRMDCFPRKKSRHGIHGGAVETSIMLARYPQQRAQGSDRRFSSHQHRDGEEISLALGASAGRPSRGRRRICTKAARSATPPRPPRRRANDCSITARARSANCSMTSTNSIRNCFVVSHEARA